MMNKTLPLVLVACSLSACAADPGPAFEAETEGGRQVARYQVDDDVLEVAFDPDRGIVDLWLIGGGSDAVTVSLTGADTDAEELDAFREALPGRLLGAIASPDLPGTSIDALVFGLLSDRYPY